MMSKTEENDLKVFAAAALQGLLAGYGENAHLLSEDTARQAWEYARAMIVTAPTPISYAYRHDDK